MVLLTERNVLTSIRTLKAGQFNLSLFLIKHDAMKRMRVMEVWLHAFQHRFVPGKRRRAFSFRFWGPKSSSRFIRRAKVSPMTENES
jgi:hypothetical protein